MKIGKMFRWYWQNTYWGLVGFYGAMLFLMLLGFVIMVFSSTEEVSVNGFAFSAEIMLLVMGIIFFPAGTRFGLSNGVSRKTVFCGMVCKSRKRLCIFKTGKDGVFQVFPAIYLNYGGMRWIENFRTG